MPRHYSRRYPAKRQRLDQDRSSEVTATTYQAKVGQKQGYQSSWTSSAISTLMSKKEAENAPLRILSR
ncbi:unnamed protein product [Toxocara canis]|uniref:Uncharacterized protein n=1 Tax=Toxocara canis TaxID=6265 RepID=A0A183V0I2_TOXCA|nr:unnamed protein product [Toxocara canis]